MSFETKIRKARFVSTGWTGEQMAQAGNGLIQHGILPRIRSGMTVNDAPAKPLSKRYASAKTRKGIPAIRNWTWTGRTLRSMKVTTAQQNRAVISFTDAVTNKKAYINNSIVRQFGVSPGDRRVLEGELQKLPSPVQAVEIA